MHLLSRTSYIWLLLLIITIGFTAGCKSKKIITKPEAEKSVDTANQDGNEVDYDEAVKKHFEMQSDRTKRMMIQSDKMRTHKNYGKNRQWYDQLFNNSCFRNSAMVKTGHSYSTVTNNGSCFIKD